MKASSTSTRGPGTYLPLHILAGMDNAHAREEVEADGLAENAHGTRDQGLGCDDSGQSSQHQHRIENLAGGGKQSAGCRLSGALGFILHACMASSPLTGLGQEA